MRRLILASFALVSFLGYAAMVSAHCQVPCGIYDDELRFQLMTEHVTTVEKAMTELATLTAASPVNYNQIVRWTHTKETHAEEIQTILNDYFFTQRVKVVEAGAEGYDDYVASLKLVHAATVAAMKCKQTTDLANVTALRTSLDAYHGLYFKGKDHTHE